MGGTNFYVRAKGATVEGAFKAAVAEAQYEHGHGGYTGTIAEKTSFQLFTGPQNSEMSPQEFAEFLLSKGFQPGTVTDKWGPAGAIDLGNGEFLFFGVSPS